MYDAVIVGSGPNGLAAAVHLARAGWKVLVLEARDTIGGGTRTAELTLPGFRHDICAAVLSLGKASPFYRRLPLDQYGVEWIEPDIPLAHPLDNGRAAFLHQSVEETAAQLGSDGSAYQSLMAPLVKDWDKIAEGILGPLQIPPPHLIALTRFGLKALPPASWLIKRQFQGEAARALLAGLAGHAMMPLEQLATSAFGLVLGLTGHVVGWPFPRGGAQSFSCALADYLRALGGEIETDHVVESLASLPPSRTVFLDVAPRQVLKIAGDALPSGYRRQLERFRYGMGVFKIDWALSDPIPWLAEGCRRAGTLHLGGTFEEIAAGERAIGAGQIPEKPYVLLTQPSIFDRSRAPAGKHTAWAYCHVPHGSNVDMTQAIEQQVERFAPGFRDCILARHTMTAVAMERYNPNYVGGDINGGVQDLRQLFTRPVMRLTPYRTPRKGLYLCSSSTPPGGGVHGMCGYHAAKTALADMDS